MSAQRWVGLVVAGAGTAAALVAGVVAERRVVREREAGAAGADLLGSLRGEARTVLTEDGVGLHAEVDEVAPYAGPAKNRQGNRRGRPSRQSDPTMVFVHGYAVNLDCWHFQREYFRGKRRMVFYDQRSHGRSGRSDNAHATVDQLGHDLDQVLRELVPEGPVVLVGHSMGGMAVMAFAEHHPDVFDERVVGVALVSTAAGGFKTHHVVSRLIPDALAAQVAPRLVAGLAHAPALVDQVRRRGSNIGYAVSHRLSFGGAVPPSYVEFVDNMLAATPFDVIAQFFPNFDALDKFSVLERFADVATYVISGTSDAMTSVEHSRAIAARIPGAKLVECAEAGHMVIFECKDRVNAVLDELLAAAGTPRASRVS